jgi:muramoyltetrapeptide carboxypeptidase
LSAPIFLPPPGPLGVCSPASPLGAEEQREAFRRGLRGLDAHGYEVVLSPSHDVRQKNSFLAGDDRTRLGDLRGLFANPAVPGVMASRGGYGAMRLLEDLDFSTLPAGKPLVGYSDLTALHLARLKATGVGGWHAPMVTQLGRMARRFRADALKTLAGRGARIWCFPSADCGLREGRATGPLVGGNLTMLAALSGTAFFPDLEGAILMLEDVGEAAYRLDRLFQILRLSGRLAGIGGVVLGGFEKCEPRGAVLDSVRDFVGRLPGVPAARRAPFGHGSVNKPWWYGETAELVVPGDAAPVLSFLER